MSGIRFFDGRWRTDGVEQNCKQCGKPYIVRKSKAGKRKYCSHECHHATRRSPVLILNCAICGQQFERALNRSGSGSYHFCSRKCQSKGQKIGLIKKGNGRPPQTPRFTCAVCGKTGRSMKREESDYLCESCRQDKYNKKPISDFFHYGRQASKYCRIRQMANTVTNRRKQVCEATGYTKRVMTCHLVPISSFSPSAPLGVVNDDRNLALLCPNAHWEFDHGELSIEDLGRRDSFYQYCQEVVLGGWAEEGTPPLDMSLQGVI